MEIKHLLKKNGKFLYTKKMEENKIILPDVSLCAIVRDEKMNPAGGIERFVASHVPFVEEAVIVDTGSVDGTREILEELRSKYSNLKIFDHKFEGFADARNYSLSKVKTKYALVLDADELITHKTQGNNWEKIKRNMREFSDYYYFNFKNIRSNGEIVFRSYWPHRLFTKESKMNEGKDTIWEFHEGLEKGSKVYTGAEIIHFISNDDLDSIKRKKFYRDGIKDEFKSEIINKNIAPSQIPGFTEWKKYNPQRDFYE